MSPVAALIVLACVVGLAQAGEAPSFEACDASLASLGDDLKAQACVDSTGRASCCDQVRGLFGEGGRAEFCLCNAEFFSTLLMGVSGHNGVKPSDYVGMLERCNVPVAGKLTCPGVDEEKPVEPVVKSQIFAKAFFLRELAGGSLGGIKTPLVAPKKIVISAPAPKKVVVAAPVKTEAPEPATFIPIAPKSTGVAESDAEVVAITPKRTGDK
ncbi:hypothetical protein BSKO_09194 [Bryopsis sp. KO-2023]|nr:hypothetical protein BSKO_09194 [Bryopsis sp. KO-2023]